MDAKVWAMKHGIEDDEAMERIKWGINIFNGTISSIEDLSNMKDQK